MIDLNLRHNTKLSLSCLSKCYNSIAREKETHNMLQETTQKLTDTQIEEHACKMHKEKRDRQRAYVYNLCLELSRDSINEWLDSQPVQKDTHTLARITDTLHTMGIKQYVKYCLFTLVYDSLFSAILQKFTHKAR